MSKRDTCLADCYWMLLASWAENFVVFKFTANKQSLSQRNGSGKRKKLLKCTSRTRSNVTHLIERHGTWQSFNRTLWRNAGDCAHRAATAGAATTSATTAYQCGVRRWYRRRVWQLCRDDSGCRCYNRRYYLLARVLHLKSDCLERVSVFVYLWLFWQNWYDKKCHCCDTVSVVRKV